MSGKKIGKIEINFFGDSHVVDIKKHYNSSEHSKITLRGMEEIEDVIHTLKQVKSRFQANPGVILPDNSGGFQE